VVLDDFFLRRLIHNFTFYKILQVFDAVGIVLLFIESDRELLQNFQKLKLGLTEKNTVAQQASASLVNPDD
jgi:hypothetical protein